MESSDTDSGEGRTDSVTAANVLLGYASTEKTDDPFSHLGGYPVGLTWEHGQSQLTLDCRPGSMIRGHLRPL